MGFLRRVHGVTLRDKVRRCETGEVLYFKPLLQIERSLSATLVRPYIGVGAGKVLGVRRIFAQFMQTCPKKTLK